MRCALAYPKQVSCTVVRHGTRVEVGIVAALSFLDAGSTAAMMVKNISLGGDADSIKEPIGIPGEAFRMKFKVCIAGEDIYLDLPVILRSVQAEESKGSYHHGFEFGRINTRDKLALGAFLHEARSEKK